MSGAIYINGEMVTDPAVLAMTMSEFCEEFNVDYVDLVPDQPNGKHPVHVWLRIRLLAVQRRKRQARARTGRRK